MSLMSDIAFGFMSPSMQKRIIEQEKDYLKRRMKETKQVWNEDKTKFSKLLCLDGESFNNKRYQLFNSRPVKAHYKKLIESKSKSIRWSPNRKFFYANRVWKAFDKLQIAQGHRRGEVAFDTDIVIPALMEYRPEISWEPIRVWMSITPMELLTQRQGVRLAKGKVLIGGLGMGWLLWKVARKKSVKEIVVVEKSREILNWFGFDLCKQVSDETGKHIHVICDDVLNHMGKHGKDTRHLIDIWPSYPNEFWSLPKDWHEAIGKVEHFWGWGVLADRD